MLHEDKNKDFSNYYFGGIVITYVYKATSIFQNIQSPVYIMKFIAGFFHELRYSLIRGTFTCRFQCPGINKI